LIPLYKELKMKDLMFNNDCIPVMRENEVC